MLKILGVCVVRREFEYDRKSIPLWGKWFFVLERGRKYNTFIKQFTHEIKYILFISHLRRHARSRTSLIKSNSIKIKFASTKYMMNVLGTVWGRYFLQVKNAKPLTCKKLLGVSDGIRTRDP